MIFLLSEVKYLFIRSNLQFSNLLLITQILYNGDTMSFICELQLFFSQFATYLSTFYALYFFLYREIVLIFR